MNNETASVKAFFESIQVHLSDVWLESCVNWCKTENLPPNYSLKDLQSKVYEQWLLLDLRDVEAPSLPPDLSSKKHFVLNGNFCLQMMQVVDISKPKLWQLQRIRNSNLLTRGTQQDVDVAGGGKRALQLTLTDGVQEVEAMEYRPITSLNINMSPGIKIRIMGPVVVRRGRLMLEQQNVKVLGGEVEELLVSHAAENVLARFLKLPENPNPASIEEKLLSVENEETLQGPKINLAISKAQIEHIPSSVKVNAAITDEEEMRIAQEIDLLLEAEKDILQPQNSNSKTPDMFADINYNEHDFDNLPMSSTSTQICNRPRAQKMKDLSSLDVENDVFNDLDIDAHLNDIDNRSECKPPQQVTGPPIITIAKLVENKNNINKGIFKIKAKFKSVVEKLTIGDDGYKIVIKIEDVTSQLVVCVHSDIISDFAGYSPAAILSLKNNILEKDGDAVQKVMKAIQKVKDRLVLLDHVLTIQVEKNEVPIIMKIE